MADRDQDRGYGGRGGEDRQRRGDDRAGDDRRGGGWERDRDERRSFGEDRRFNSDQDRYGPGSHGRRFEGGEPWRSEGRWDARYDQDRAGYRDMGGDGARFGGYRGQEYGMEGGAEHRSGRDRWSEGSQERETWRPDHGAPYGDLELNARNRGVQEYGAPHDYAYHPQQGHEFDPEYMSWRDQQMKGHDRDYQAWRKHQQQQYDDDYRQFREHRRDTFGRTFHEWRSQKNTTGGIPDTTVVPGVSGYGDKTGIPGGYNTASYAKPSGMPEAPDRINADPAARQTGGDGGTAGGSSATGQQAGGSSSASGQAGSEFGKEPPQVKAAASGWDGRGAPEDETARKADEARARDDDRRRDEQREVKRDEKK